MSWKNKIEDVTLEKRLQRLIISSCGAEYGVNYKKNIPLKELIERMAEKFRLTQDQIFALYVSAPQNIVEGIKKEIQFIDLNGMDLSWTAEEIIGVVMNIYNSIPTITLEDYKNRGGKIGKNKTLTKS